MEMEGLLQLVERRVPKVGDQVLVTGTDGNVYPATIDGLWIDENGLILPSGVANIRVVVEGKEHLVECVHHRDDAFDPTLTYWMWPDERAEK